ncbi:MAG: tetratricopeptide repeat protein [Acidobacteriota bacterium]
MTLTTRLVGLILTLYLHFLTPLPAPPPPQNAPQSAIISSTRTLDQQSVAALYELLDAGAWKKALDQLRSMQSADARLYEQNRFPYLEARLLLKTGQPEPALLLLQRTRATDPLLERRILQQMVEAQRALGRSNEEASLLEQLLSRFAAQVSADSLRLRLAQLEQRRGNPRRALEYLSAVQDKALRRRAGFERAAIHQAQGNISEARREWNALVAGSTTDDWALKAARALDRAEPATVAEDARWRRAEIYSANREFAAAEKHLQALRSLPASRATDLYFFQTARNDFQAGRNEQAIEAFREVARRFPESDFAAQAEYLVANTYLRQLKYAEAVAAYRSARRRYPHNPHLENAWNNEVAALRWLQR